MSERLAAMHLAGSAPAAALRSPTAARAGNPQLAGLARGEPLDTTAEIETPEHVRFHYHLAGPAKRFFAYFIDLLIRGVIIGIFAACLLLAGFSMGDELGQASVGVISVIVFVVEWFYYVVWEALWSGRTPGKRALRLRVIGHEGHPLRVGQSVLRNLLRAADWLPSFYAIGVVVMGRDARFRRLGDLVAGTMVVVENRSWVEGPLRIDPPPTPNELSSLPQKLPLSGDDLEAIELLLRREPRLSAARAYELAAMVAPIYGARLNLTVHHPLRFLKVLYARARGVAVLEDRSQPAWRPAQPPQPAGGFQQQQAFHPSHGYAQHGPPQQGHTQPGYQQGYTQPGYQQGYTQPGYQQGYTQPGYPQQGHRGLAPPHHQQPDHQQPGPQQPGWERSPGRRYP